MTTEQYESCDAALCGIEAAVNKAIAELDLIDARERIGSGSGE